MQMYFILLIKYLYNLPKSQYLTDSTAIDVTQT
jgi:hypothetical protein